ncbi:MAG: ribosome maturation factor RimM [Candidatus Aminicenantales bacterium]
MINVARILRSQGKKGELRLRFHYISPADCTELKSVFIGSEGALREYKIESLVLRGRDYDLKLEGVDGLSQADSLAGLDVFLPPESLRKRENGEFYLFQLIGCRVTGRDGLPIGRVRDVLSSGGSALLRVESGEKEILVPFHTSICTEVDVEAKEIRLDPPDGLLDVNEI